MRSSINSLISAAKKLFMNMLECAFKHLCLLPEGMFKEVTSRVHRVRNGHSVSSEILGASASEGCEGCINGGRKGGIGELRITGWVQSDESRCTSYMIILSGGSGLRG